MIKYYSQEWVTLEYLLNQALLTSNKYYIKQASDILRGYKVQKNNEEQYKKYCKITERITELKWRKNVLENDIKRDNWSTYNLKFKEYPDYIRTMPPFVNGLEWNDKAPTEPQKLKEFIIIKYNKVCDELELEYAKLP